MLPFSFFVPGDFLDELKHFTTSKYIKYIVIFFVMDDRGSYERISIRECAASLKKYGSTSKHVSRIENCIKHHVSNTDTLQGIALKYNVTVSYSICCLLF